MDTYFKIFRAGKHPDSVVPNKEFTEKDLDDIVLNYSNRTNDAPLVIGHPNEKAPAYGWVESLKREGDTLMCKFKQLSEGIVEAVRNGHYKNVSVSLRGTDKGLRLEHVGLLGAAAPGVKGLGDIVFNQNDSDINIETELENPITLNKDNNLQTFAEQTTMDEKAVIAFLQSNAGALNAVMKAFGLVKEQAQDPSKNPKFSEIEGGKEFLEAFEAQKAQNAKLQNELLDMKFSTALKDAPLTDEQKGIAKNIMHRLTTPTFEFAEGKDPIDEFKSILGLIKSPVELGKMDFSADEKEMITKQQEAEKLFGEGK